MMDYAKIHQSKLSTIDVKMQELITNSCKTDNEVAVLTEIWNSDANDQEYHATEYHDARTAC